MSPGATDQDGVLKAFSRALRDLRAEVAEHEGPHLTIPVATDVAVDARWNDAPMPGDSVPLLAVHVRVWARDGGLVSELLAGMVHIGYAEEFIRAVVAKTTTDLDY